MCVGLVGYWHAQKCGTVGWAMDGNGASSASGPEGKWGFEGLSPRGEMGLRGPQPPRGNGPSKPNQCPSKMAKILIMRCLKGIGFERRSPQKQQNPPRPGRSPRPITHPLNPYLPLVLPALSRSDSFNCSRRLILSFCRLMISSLSCRLFFIVLIVWSR